MPEVFSEFALLLMCAAATGALALWLRQPVLMAYIVVGIVVGPAVFGWVTAHDQIDLLAQIGVTVLLFVVGLKLDLQHVRHIGPVALATGLGQLTFTIIFGFGLILWLGRSPMEALYVAVALTFSSTIIIVKLLSDKREIDALHGRIAVGFLIVQDLAVVLAMMVMSALRGADESSLLALGASLLGRIALAVLVLWVLMRWVLPSWVAQMARSQELLLIFAVAWGTALAALGEWAGFSKEAGAFLAGFSLASTPFRDAIHARLTGIRDFLLLFFFIDLGAKLDFSMLGSEVGAALVLSAFVLVGNPLIVMAIMGFMGYRRRTGFLAGLTVAQISEFSIIFVAMGISLGHVGPQALGLTTLVGLITIALSTYMILYSHPLFERLGPWLGWFERRDPFRERNGDADHGTTPPLDVMVVGLGRYGAELALALHARGLAMMGVDYDPEQVRHLQSLGLAVRYGDASSDDFLESLPLAQTRWLVSALPDTAAHQALMRGLAHHHFQGAIAWVNRDPEPALLAAGQPPDVAFVDTSGLTVHTVLHPHRDAVAQAVQHLTHIIADTKETP